MTDITQFHIDNKYYVKVQSLKYGGSGCIVHFPENILLNKPPVVKTYILSHDPYTIDLFAVKDKGLESKTLEVKSSNIRLLVLQDVFLTTNSLGLSRKLIMVENSNSNLFDMLKLPQTQEEIKLETQLCVKFRELLVGNVVTSDIDGYEQVLFCFENGGL